MQRRTQRQYVGLLLIIGRVAGQRIDRFDTSVILDCEIQSLRQHRPIGLRSQLGLRLIRELMTEIIVVLQSPGYVGLKNRTLLRVAEVDAWTEYVLTDGVTVAQRNVVAVLETPVNGVVELRCPYRTRHND